MHSSPIVFRSLFGQYDYYIVTSPLPAAAGNYCFAVRSPDGLFTPLYFGETGDLSTRFRDHHTLDAALQLGMTHLLAARVAGGVDVRCQEEEDLISFWNPVLNIQHNRLLPRLRSS